jgi:hypothetical protein
LRALGVRIFPSVLVETDEGEIAQHVIPPSARLHFPFPLCWCEPDESDPSLIEHRAV